MKVRKAIKQMAALGTGAVMVGASLTGALAADHVDLGAYPSQFIDDGKFNGVMVVGDKAAADDVIGVTDIAVSLQSAAVKKVSGSSSTSVTVDGEAWKVGTSTKILEMSERLTTGDNRESIANITNLQFIDEQELPNLLSSGAVSNSKGTAEFDQRLYFEDPTTGYVIFSEDDDTDVTADFLFFDNNKQIARYELEFTTSLESDVDDSTGSADSTGLFLTDMEDVEITLLGKPFTIVTAKRNSAAGTSVILTMMGGAVRDTLLEGDTKTYTVDGKDFEVTLNFVDSDEAQFVVNGETTQKINDGDTDILADGTTVGVSDILYQDYAGGVHSATFFIGADKVELKDTNIGDTASSDNLEINEEDIEEATVVIEGTDDNTTFRIDRIAINMTADDDFYVPAGGKLSEVPDLDEPEVIFTQNWDITYEGLTHNVQDANQIRVKSSGSDEYELEFVDASGDKASVPLVAASAASRLKLGGDAADESLVLSENQTIRDENYILVSDQTDEDGERSSYALQYTGADDLNTDNQQIRFKNLGSGETIERPITVGTELTGEFLGNGSNTTAGGGHTSVFQIAQIKIGGATFGVYNVSSMASDDFEILVDLDASSSITNEAIDINTKNGAKVALFNDTANGFRVQVSTPNTDDFDDLLPTTATYNLSADSSAEVQMAKQGNLAYTTPDDDDDRDYAYTSYGAYIMFDDPSGDSQEEFTVWYPEEQAVPLVYVVGAGAGVSKVESVGDGDAVVLQKIDVGATKLASEVADITAVNSILVGGPCANAAAATVMGNPSDCAEGFKPGVGRVMIWGVGSGDNVAMLVAGYSAIDTRNAAQVVAQYKKYAGWLTGDEVEVTKVNNQVTVAKPTVEKAAMEDSMEEASEESEEASEESTEETA